MKGMKKKPIGSSMSSSGVKTMKKSMGNKAYAPKLHVMGKSKK